MDGYGQGAQDANESHPRVQNHAPECRNLPRCSNTARLNVNERMTEMYVQQIFWHFFGPKPMNNGLIGYCPQEPPSREGVSPAGGMSQQQAQGASTQEGGGLQRGSLGPSSRHSIFRQRRRKGGHHKQSGPGWGHLHRQMRQVTPPSKANRTGGNTERNIKHHQNNTTVLTRVENRAGGGVERAE